VRLSQLAGEALTTDPDIRGLTADSRAVERGFLFAALPGVLADGAKFIPQAEERGAAAILARPGARSNLPIVIDREPRQRLAHMAAQFFARQPEIIAGITGTNGKTSTALFAAQLWQGLGRKSASLGTLGVRGKSFKAKLTHTTPEPVTLHKMLDEMTAAGVTHLAMEVSSHGLAQHRADAVKFKIAAFTNLTQDHLDYHQGFDDYLNAKLRLFSELLDEDGVAVVNKSSEYAERFCDAAAMRGVKVIGVGADACDIKLTKVAPHTAGLDISIDAFGAAYNLNLPLVGAFQAENALLAAGIVIASGAPVADVLAGLENLKSVPGRMQLAAHINEAAVYVDYAHTPDAVATALKGLRPHTEGRLVAIIGAGGDRDKAKRPMMGRAAMENADIVIVTDDNPRNEDPAVIRREVMAGCPQATEIGDRREAIAAGTAMLKAGDVLLIAGKGHETGQVAGGETFAFNDIEVAREAAKALSRSKELG
jgi:UDP-N-acetylmuramoyl-L-alanyl-D-glutamate--2,6-diaminopimelate ligase